MTPKGFRAIAAAIALLIAEIALFLWTGSRLESRTRSDHIQKPADPVRTDVLTADGEAVGPKSGQEIAGGNSGSSAITQVLDIAEMTQNGLLKGIHWGGGNHLFPDTQAIADLLLLQPNEAVALQRIVSTTEVALTSALVRGAVVSRTSPTEIVATFNEVPDVDQSVREMQRAIKELLGEDRWKVYDLLGAKGRVDENLGNLALAGGTMTITRVGDRSFRSVRHFPATAAGKPARDVSDSSNSIPGVMAGLEALVPDDF